MSAAAILLLGWMPFVTPLPLPASSQLWMFPPLALCIAVVYRATRVRPEDPLFRSSVVTWVNIIVGMSLIAIAVYGLHAFVLWMS